MFFNYIYLKLLKYRLIMKKMTLENRVPHEYFITSGKGSSNLEIHAGSYHMALYDANICDFNIQTYSSVIPKTAKKISKDVIQKIPFGSELYTIMSCIHGKKGENISCGIIFGDLIDTGTNKKIGSLVCEISGNYEEKVELKERLLNVIKDLHQKTYINYKLDNLNSITNSYIPEEKFGTCLIALCFTSFI